MNPPRTKTAKSVAILAFMPGLLFTGMGGSSLFFSLSTKNQAIVTTVPTWVLMLQGLVLISVGIGSIVGAIRGWKGERSSLLALSGAAQLALGALLPFTVAAPIPIPVFFLIMGFSGLWILLNTMAPGGDDPLR